jgi:ATP-binding cassette subfamily B protein
MTGLLLLGGFRILAPGVSEATAHVRAEALVGYYLMAGTFFGPVTSIGNIYNQALTARAGAERVFPNCWIPSRSLPTSRTPSCCRRLKARIEFRNLSFGYEPDQLVLHDINFTALPGQTVALLATPAAEKAH